MALKNGTMGWELAGFQVARGQVRHAADPSPAGLSKAQAAVAKVRTKFGVRCIDSSQLKQWQDDAGVRTLYLLDVRTSQEYAAGHLPGSRHAPGGQLVQATDEYAVTRHARIVLVDDNGVRASMSASWLLQMGWKDVYVLSCGLDSTLEQGAGRLTLLGFTPATIISVTDLAARIEHNPETLVLDFGTSLHYRKQHIPGAWWGVRSRLTQALLKVQPAQEVSIASADGILAHYIAREVRQLRPEVAVQVVEGGTRAWLAAGYATESGADRFTCEPNDIWYKPYEQPGGVRQAMENYLTWEVNLIPQIERDGEAKFL